MATLNVNSVELVTTERTAPLNGAPSSSDYNDTIRELLTDLSTLSDLINTSILPLINSLPAMTSLVLDGDGLFASHTGSALFVDSTSGAQLSVSDVLTKINASNQALASQITDLSARVQSLQSQLATTNQIDVARSIQGFNLSLTGLVNRVATLETKVSTLS
jgi:hypothetical protein